MRIASATCTPIRKTGLSDVIGSWKTMAMSLPRTVRISLSGRSARLRPLNRISPAVIFPGVATSRMIDIAVTLLPHPDSPTSASASPRRTLKETLSTAWIHPLGRKGGAEVLHLEQRLVRIRIGIRRLRLAQSDRLLDL